MNNTIKNIKEALSMAKKGALSNQPTLGFFSRDAAIEVLMRMGSSRVEAERIIDSLPKDEDTDE